MKVACKEIVPEVTSATSQHSKSFNGSSSIILTFPILNWRLIFNLSKPGARPMTHLTFFCFDKDSATFKYIGR